MIINTIRHLFATMAKDKENIEVRHTHAPTRACASFHTLTRTHTPTPPRHARAQVICSYLEIYNETLRDLLNPGDQSLDLREHPVHGR